MINYFFVFYLNRAAFNLNPYLVIMFIPRITSSFISAISTRCWEVVLPTRKSATIVNYVLAGTPVAVRNVKLLDFTHFFVITTSDFRIVIFSSVSISRSGYSEARHVHKHVNKDAIVSFSQKCDNCMHFCSFFVVVRQSPLPINQFYFACGCLGVS